MSFGPVRKSQVMKGLAIFLGLVAGRLGAVEWQALAPEEFAVLPAVQARVDFEDFDPALMSAAIFHEANRVRRRLGLAAFRHVAGLDRAAEMKAVMGVMQKELTHENPVPGTASPADRVKASGVEYRAVAENIARQSLLDLPAGVTEMGVRTRNGRTEYYHLGTKRPVELRTYAGFAEAVVRAWMESPGHRANLVNPLYTALGCAARPCRSEMARHEQVYAVQVFLTPR